MHTEHFELIAALRAENDRLTRQNAELGALRAIIDAQDKLLASASAELARQEKFLREVQRQLEEMQTP
jgi:septal ring factor EnvC (AmiA/AmiB activator)